VAFPTDDATTRRLDLFRVLVEEAREYAIYLLDPQGRLVSWNAGAERIKGYSASETSASVRSARAAARSAV